MSGERAAKERLDLLLVQRGLASSRVKAQALILAGRVQSEGVRLEKPGLRYPRDVSLEVKPGRRYVSRGGHKLEGALRALQVDPQGCDALDCGASTGGFTQVLLESGARRVIALDVGRGQLDWTLRNDDRVIPLEGANARHLEPDELPFSPQIVVVDVSFISLRLILPALVRCLTEMGELIILAKPQFEVGRGQVGRGGIVRDPALHQRVLLELCEFAAAHDWGVAGLCGSELRGAGGNREFFLHLVPGRPGLAGPVLRRRIVEISQPIEEPNDEP